MAVNVAIDGGVAEEIVAALQSDVLEFKDVTPDIAEYYCDGLVKKKNEKQDVSCVLVIIISYSLHICI